MRFVVPALLAVALAASAAAQTSFYADIDGTKETPANGSTAGAWAKVTLNPGNTLTYEVHSWGLTATAAPSARKGPCWAVWGESSEAAES